MTTSIAARIYRRIEAATRCCINVVAVNRRTRRWRREALRAMRQRSRE